jgi:hypothetical protein
MKNTTILIILLLFVSSTIYIKEREGLAPQFSNDGYDASNNKASIEKHNIMNDINSKINGMDVDYKVFNDETTNMAKQQQSYYYVLSVITAIVVIFTLYYFLK